MTHKFDNLSTWDKIAHDYKRTSFFGRRLFKGEKERLYSIIDSPTTLIDIGCGTGRHLKFLKHVQYIVGLDFSYNMLYNIPTTVKEYTSLVQANAKSIPFPDKFFDIAIMLGNALGNVRKHDRKRAMNEAIRVSKKAIFELRISKDAKDELRQWKNDPNKKYMSHTWTIEEIKEFFINHQFDIVQSTTMKNLKMMYVIVHN